MTLCKYSRCRVGGDPQPREHAERCDLGRRRVAQEVDKVFIETTVFVRVGIPFTTIFR